MSSDELKHEVTRLKDCLVRAEPCKYQQVLVGWCDEVKQQHGEAAGNFAFDLLTIIKICGVPNFIHQEINVNRNVNVGGDVTGSVIGDSNLTEIGDVSVYKNDVDQAATINPELRDALKAGRDAFEALGVSPEMKKTLLENYGKLTIELKKPAPDNAAIQYLWGGISAFAKGVKPLIQVGKLLAAQFGIYLPIPD